MARCWPRRQRPSRSTERHCEMEGAFRSKNGSMWDLASRENQCRSIPWPTSPPSVSASRPPVSTGTSCIDGCSAVSLPPVVAVRRNKNIAVTNLASAGQGRVARCSNVGRRTSPSAMSARPDKEQVGAHRQGGEAPADTDTGSFRQRSVPRVPATFAKSIATPETRS